MVRTSVVDYLVLDDLHAEAMRRINQLAKLRMRAEVLLDNVRVLRVVTVKPGARVVFLQLDLIETIVVVVPRRQPDRRDAELVQIRQAVDHALKVAAVVIK